MFYSDPSNVIVSGDAFCPPGLESLLDSMQLVVHKDNFRLNEGGTIFETLYISHKRFHVRIVYICQKKCFKHCLLMSVCISYKTNICFSQKWLFLYIKIAFRFFYLIFFSEHVILFFIFSNKRQRVEQIWSRRWHAKSFVFHRTSFRVRR